LRNGKKIGDIVSYLVLALAVVIALFPLLYLLSMSFKPRGLITTKPTLWLFKPSLEHYHKVIVEGFFLKYLFNSIIVATSSTIITLIVSLPAAFSIARFRVGGENISFWILSIKMLPPMVFLVPIYVIFQHLRLLDRLVGLIIVYVAFNSPLAVWLLRSFIEELPKEVEEQAMVDGCTRLSAFSRVVIPLLIPGILVTIALTFISSWNEFLMALILTLEKARTITVAASEYITGYGILWGDIAAAGVIAIIPNIILAVTLQRYLVRGLTLGIIKG